MLLCVHDDPDMARDFGLEVIEREIERLPPLGKFRDRAADIAAKLFARACEDTTCESHQHQNSGGNGGRPQSPAKSRPSTSKTLKPGSTPSESSDTASGPKAQCSPPASGGNPKPTPKPAN